MGARTPGAMAVAAPALAVIAGFSPSSPADGGRDFVLAGCKPTRGRPQSAPRLPSLIDGLAFDLAQCFAGASVRVCFLTRPVDLCLPGNRRQAMTDEEIQEFVTKFAAAWAARDSEAFLALWHPDGVLFYPLANRPIAGNELGRLNELQKQS